MISVLLLLLGVLLPSASADEIGIMANSIFTSASVSINSSMKATFSASLDRASDISVTCALEKKVDGVWKSAGSLPSPGSKSNAISYSASKDYSSYCTKGNTYRVVAKYTAGGESVTRYSGQVAY